MNLLMFESKRLSYDSSWYFMEMLRRGFEKLGARITVFVLEDVDRQEEELLSLCRQKFDAVFDTNSALASAKIDDDRYYMDCFEAPFYHFIVDHPLHVHRALSTPLRDYHVICLDHYHKEYIRQYYPNIKDVIVMPFGGIAVQEFAEEKRIPMEKRPIQILFPGTYTPLAYYQEQMEAHGEHYFEIAQELLKEYQNGSKRPIHEMLKEQFQSDEDFFALKLHKARYIEKYIREWYRQSILEALLQKDIIVDVVGFRWEMYQGENVRKLRRYAPCTYGKQLGMLGQSKMVLNVQPLFLDGVHDRVMNAMMNQSVAITDSCEFLQRNFVSDREVILFDKNTPEKMAEWVQDNQWEFEKLKEISERAYNKCRENHSWYQRAKGLIEKIKS